MLDQAVPAHLTQKDNYIVICGILPDIPLSTSHKWEEICEIIQTCSKDDLGFCGPGDFKFIGTSGKQTSVPNHKPEFVFTANTVKKVAGGGSVDCPASLTKHMTMWNEKLICQCDYACSDAHATLSWYLNWKSCRTLKFRLCSLPNAAINVLPPPSCGKWVGLIRDLTYKLCPRGGEFRDKRGFDVHMLSLLLKSDRWT